jgi:hypothetical protein
MQPTDALLPQIGLVKNPRAGIRWNGENRGGFFQSPPEDLRSFPLPYPPNRCPLVNMDYGVNLMGHNRKIGL